MKEITKNIIESNLHDSVKGLEINLSNEFLSIADYEWLAEIIKRSSFVEIVRLPEISKENCKIILSTLNLATIKNSSIKVIELNIPNDISEDTEEITALYRQIESR